jgi:hypothetical protein
MTPELHPLNDAFYGQAPALINQISVLSDLICLIKDIFKLSVNGKEKVIYTQKSLNIRRIGRRFGGDGVSLIDDPPKLFIRRQSA